MGVVLLEFSSRPFTITAGDKSSVVPNIATNVSYTSMS